MMKSTQDMSGRRNPQRAATTLQITLQRSTKAMSQAQISAAAGVSTRTVGQVLNGTYATKPSPDYPKITAKQLTGYIEALTRLSLYLELDPIEVVKEYGITPELPGVVERINQVLHDRRKRRLRRASQVPDESLYAPPSATHRPGRSQSRSMVTQGAETFLNFVSVLQEELERAGGHPSMLYFAQKEHARPMMALLARTIVASGLWKVPKSFILEEMWQCPHRDKHYWEDDVRHHWWSHSNVASSLTTLRFARNPHEYDNEPMEGIPDVGPYEKCGDIVELEGRKYVVTYTDGDALYLAPADWIDLDR